MHQEAAPPLAFPHCPVTRNWKGRRSGREFGLVLRPFFGPGSALWRCAIPAGSRSFYGISGAFCFLPRSLFTSISGRQGCAWHCGRDGMVPLPAGVRGLRQDAVFCSSPNSGTPDQETCGSLMRNLLIVHCIDHEQVRMGPDVVQLAVIMPKRQGYYPA